MRYAAKLSVIKRDRNFKNICYTVSKRHQHLCYHLNCRSLLNKVLTHGKCSMGLAITDCKNELKATILHSIPYASHHVLVYTTAWVDSREMYLKVNMFLFLYPIYWRVAVGASRVDHHRFVIISTYTPQFGLPTPTTTAVNTTTTPTLNGQPASGIICNASVTSLTTQTPIHTAPTVSLTPYIQQIQQPAPTTTPLGTTVTLLPSTVANKQPLLPAGASAALTGFNLPGELSGMLPHNTKKKSSHYSSLT